MATEKPKPHVYKVSRTHAIASKLKPGDMMQARMKMLPPDEGAEGAGDADYNMEEQEASPYVAPLPKKGKPKTPAEAIREKAEKLKS